MHRYGNATTAQFVALAEQVSGRDLTVLLPDLVVGQDQAGELQLRPVSCADRDSSGRLALVGCCSSPPWSPRPSYGRLARHEHQGRGLPAPPKAARRPSQPGRRRGRGPLLPEGRQRRATTSGTTTSRWPTSRRATTCPGRRRSRPRRPRTCPASTSTSAGMTVRAVRVNHVAAQWVRSGEELVVTPGSGLPKGQAVHRRSGLRGRRRRRSSGPRSSSACRLRLAVHHGRRVRRRRAERRQHLVPGQRPPDRQGDLHVPRSPCRPARRSWRTAT